MKKIPILILTAVLALFPAIPVPAADNDAAATRALRARILETARKYLGARYNYGGTGAQGFDCSGFVQFVYRQNGITLPRSTVDQFVRGKKIDLVEARPGDLLFFRIWGGRVSHVGIFVSAGRFIHAPSQGKRVSYADMNLPYWKNTFAGAITFIADDSAPLPDEKKAAR